MWLIVQHPKPDDYLLGTGETHSVCEFVEKVCLHVGIRIEWFGSGADERGIESETGLVLVEVDPRYFRPTEVDVLMGDPSRRATN